MITGIIPLYKPIGMTSFVCVSKIRGIVGQKRVGHSGTLDPNVDGVLPICLGNATKVVEQLMSSGKTYRGAITLGFSTTTEDLDGEIVDTNFNFVPLTDEQIDNGLAKFIGTSIQIPPMYSAVKVNGRRLYDYARKGEKVKRPKRKVTITSFKQIAPNKINKKNNTQTIYFEVKCGKGTYVRTLAVDFGKQFDIPAVMSQLTRIKSGGFALNETVTFEQLDNAKKNNDLAKLIKPIDVALQSYKDVELNDTQWQLVQHGGFISLPTISDDKVVLRYNNEVKAMYYRDDVNNEYKPLKMFNIN